MLLLPALAALPATETLLFAMMVADVAFWFSSQSEVFPLCRGAFVSFCFQPLSHACRKKKGPKKIIGKRVKRERAKKTGNKN